mgnify:CR=1 FL=1
MKDIDTFFRISIIIPVYNMENFLTRAIDSIINQSFGFNKLEVILVDDCSSDNSRKIIEEYCEKYDNIKSVFLKENSGFAGKPRNIGLRYASADYVMFLDPDDSYFEDACNVLYEKITNENADIVSGNFIDSFFQDGKKYDWEDKFELKGDEIKVNSIKENMNLFNVYPSVWAKIFKKDFILSNNIWFPEHLPGQDLFFVHHALFKAKGIVFINKEIVYYDARDGDDDEISVSCNNSKKVLIGLIKLYYKHLSLFEKYAPNNIDIVLKSLYYWITKFIDSNLDLNEIKEELDSLVNGSKNGRLIKNGVNIAIIGKPNVGKSSILNSLLDEEKAIVTNIPGTTRDIVEGTITLNGVAINFIDTAGIRETEDIVEKIGVDKSKKTADASDLILLVLNNNEALSEEEQQMLDKYNSDKLIIFVNKMDLETKLVLPNNLQDVIYGNTIDINGLDKLKERIITKLNLDNIVNKDTYNAFLPAARAKYCINRVVEALNYKDYDFIYSKLNPVQKNNYYIKKIC